MSYPRLKIDLVKIEQNARVITGLCARHRIEVTGVTKVTCGNPQIAAAMLRGGVVGIADSRLENIHRLRAAGIPGPFMLLRLPALSRVAAVVEATGISLNSEPVVLDALSDAARRQGRVHEVILMVELGDLREGIPGDELLPLVEHAIRMPGIRIAGLGANLACFSGVVPSETNMRRLVALADAVERRFELKLRWLSGVNSSGLELIASGSMPERINHARIGEAILLGRETTHRRSWPGAHQDAFELQAEILELRCKPSRPEGERTENAFGHRPVVEDHGRRTRALVNIGHEDVDVEGIRPQEEGVEILGASSGYLALDVSSAPRQLRVGDVLSFSLNYSALLAAMTSEYVEKQPLPGNPAGGSK